VTTRLRLLTTRPAKKGARRRDRTERSERRPESAPAEPADPAAAQELFDERRMRESGGPDDRAVYACACGYVFKADVTTSVACPHCGGAQAW
jgi:rubrerythrin